MLVTYGEVVHIGIFEHCAKDKYNRSLATNIGGAKDKVCTVKAAPAANDEGFQSIVLHSSGNLYDTRPDTFADGVYMDQSGSSVIMYTADCPVVTLTETQSKTALVLHCGRVALTPTPHPDGTCRNILTHGYDFLLSQLKENLQPQLKAYVSACISAQYFTHADVEGKKLIAPFYEHFGGSVFLNYQQGTLDLRAVIDQQLKQLAGDSITITHDDVCTWETDWLSSYRKSPGTQERNPVVVVLQ